MYWRPCCLACQHNVRAVKKPRKRQTECIIERESNSTPQFDLHSGRAKPHQRLRGESCLSWQHFPSQYLLWQEHRSNIDHPCSENALITTLRSSPHELAPVLHWLLMTLSRFGFTATSLRSSPFPVGKWYCYQQFSSGVSFCSAHSNFDTQRNGRLWTCQLLLKIIVRSSSQTCADVHSDYYNVII